MKKIQILLLLAFSLFMSTGCSQKEPPVVFKNKMVCFDMQKQNQQKKYLLEYIKKILICSLQGQTNYKKI